MPKSAPYLVEWSSELATYLFVWPENEGDNFSLDSREDWFAWIEEHTTFAFHGRNGRLNLLKEKRSRGRSKGYWYAYQRHGNSMVKCYAGRSAQLSMERLEELAAQLSNKGETGHAPANPVAIEPLLVPKLQLPRLSKSLLPRKRLFDLLDKGLEGKLTLISGPAGYGKTSLVGQWIAQHASQASFPRVASITLDADDNDPLRFWRYIIAACQNYRPGCGKEALDLLLANRLLPFKPLEMMLTALLNELSQLEHPAILVLDDFHSINSPQVIETFTYFLDHLPNSLHVMILIRGEPLFSLSRLRARNELLDVYPPHLAFSLEETRAFLEQQLPFSLSPEILRKIYERLEGWPTGLRLFCGAFDWVHSEQDIEQVLAAFAGSHWSIQDYFLNEVLRTLSAEQQDFLLQTSILPRITASLCNVITGREDSAHLLETMHGSDLFLIPLDATGEWSRYQSLFAEAMQQQARKRLGDERLRQSAARASMWYAEHGLPAEAIECALDAADATRAARLMERFIANKWQDNAPAIPEYSSLRHWIERLPENVLEDSPDLCLHYALSLLFLQYSVPHSTQGNERIERLLQTAEQHWRDGNNTAKLAEMFAFRALMARQEGKMLQAVTWAKQSLTWLSQENYIWRNLALSVVGFGEVLDGTLDQALALLQDALRLGEQQSNLTYVRAVRGMLSWTRFEMGELHNAAEQFRQMQAEARAHEDLDDIAHTQLGLAHIAYEWNHLEEAEQAAREALSIAGQMRVEELQALATIRLGSIEQARGQSAQACQRLTAWLARQPSPVSPHSYQLQRQVQAALACIQLADANLIATERWCASIEGREASLPLLHRQREQLLRARILLARQESVTALALLRSLHTAALKSGHIYLRLEIQAVLALAYARQRLHEQSRQQLVQVLAIARSENFLRLFLDLGEAMADLLRGALPFLHDRGLLACARHILSAFAQEYGPAPQKITPAIPPLLDSLSLQEQKVLRLLAAGNSNAEIARELVVSINTVRSQAQSIYRKLNVNNRVEASAVAHQLEFI